MITKKVDFLEVRISIDWKTDMVVEMVQNSTFQNFFHIQHLFIHIQHLYVFSINIY